MSRQQGRHGEWKFGEICTAPNACAEAVVNKATDDQHGWDHIVEITPPENSSLPADLRARVLQCFAQIKTTNGSKPKTKLKLSNALKAAKSSLPSFVFLLKYSGETEEPIIYGRHVWEDEITRWLKRARKTEHNEHSSLHNLTVSMSFSETDRLEINPIDWILSVLTPFGEAYSAKKHELVKSVGYSEFSHEGKITFGPIESIGDVVALELGLIEHLPVTDFRVYDTRFGIKSHSPIIENSTKGQVSISHDGRPLTLQLESSSGRTFDIPAIVKFPRSVGLDHNKFKIRLRAGHIDILVSLNDSVQNIHLKYDLNLSLPLLEQVGFLCLANWSQSKPLKFHAVTNEGILFSGIINDVAIDAPWMLQAENVGHNLIEILGQDRCKNISISYHELHEICRAMNIVSSLFTANSFKIEAMFENKIEPFEKLMGYLCGQVGDWSFGVFYEAKHTKRSNNEKRISFYFNDPKIINKWVFKQPLSQMKKDISVKFKELRKNQTTPVAVFNDGDLLEWSQAYLDDGSLSLSVD